MIHVVTTLWAHALELILLKFCILAGVWLFDEKWFLLQLHYEHMLLSWFYQNGIIK